jgi:acetyl-CoA C-acetyltransferase
MQNPLIIAALRTPLGSFQGGLKDFPAPQLSGIVIRELLHRSGVPPADVTDVIMGNVLHAGLGQNPARQAAVHAGIPYGASALTIDMVCGSGIRAVSLAAQSILLGESAVIVAGGMESMSRAPHLSMRDCADGRAVSSLRYDGLRCAFSGKPMGVFAEHLARAHGIGRAAQDEYALSSHQRASASIDNGLFDPEVVPLQGPAGGDAGQGCARDECPRGDCTPEKLSILKPAFEKGGTVTAGNATPIADGAAAVLVASESYAREKGMRPLARILSWNMVGVEPRETFAALFPAVRGLLAKSGLVLSDVDVFEIADSFAVEGIVGIRELRLPADRVNIRGGTLSLGHPLGASGCRILVTLLHILKDTRKKLGLAAICLGGGNAVAMLVENLPIAQH